VNVLFVSQCSGNALTASRRILDQFAERRGKRSWQTPITWEGLQTVHKLLRQRARKNTSVACFRSYRNRSELLWVVGDIRRFNERGATPTNTTTRDLLRLRDENDWRHGEVIRRLAGLAALFHDFGKSSAAFQAKLRGNAKVRDAYRHEWVSLRLFAAVVDEAKDDTAWLRRLTDANVNLDNWQEQLLRDGLDHKPPAPLKSLPPLARTVAWLIVTHHRLPVPPGGTNEAPRSKTLETIENALRPIGAAPMRRRTPKRKPTAGIFPTVCR